MAAKTVGCRPEAIYSEMRRYPTFRRKVQEAREHGKDSVGDSAMTIIEGIAFGKDSQEKTRLTAALALANAFLPGFKGTSHFEGKIDHNHHVITAVPRPTYVNVVEGGIVKELAPVDPKCEARRAYWREYQRKRYAEKKVRQQTEKQTVALVS